MSYTRAEQKGQQTFMISGSPSAELQKNGMNGRDYNWDVNAVHYWADIPVTC